MIKDAQDGDPGELVAEVLLTTYSKEMQTFRTCRF